MSSHPFWSTARRTARGEPLGRIVGGMHAVAVGGLDQQHVGLRHRLRIHHDRHVVAAEIAGEDEAAAAELAGDEPRAQDVARRGEPRLDPARGGERAAEVHALHQASARSASAIVYSGSAGSCLLVRCRLANSASFSFSKVGRVRQHDLEEIVGARRAVDRSGNPSRQSRGR